jgi:hypothetical protein
MYRCVVEKSEWPALACSAALETPGAALHADPHVAALPLSETAGTAALTRPALHLFRELVAQGRVLWDPVDGLELAAAVERARVVERQTGLVLMVGPSRRAKTSRRPRQTLAGVRIRP